MTPPGASGSAPVVLFVYNRPQHTRQTLEALEKDPLVARTDLVVFCDGPRDDATDEDRLKIAEVRAVCRLFTAAKSLRMVERSTNAGLAQSVIAGVSQVCGEFGRVIVLEDDLLVSPQFLTYMNTALDYYAEDPKVASIHGYVWTTNQVLPETFFIRGADCWGWATWQRAWAKFKSDPVGLRDEIDARELAYEFDRDGNYPHRDLLSRQIYGEIDSWAIRWHASMYLEGMLTLYPGRSLVRNIGFDGTGVHSGTGQAQGELTAKQIHVQPIPVEEDASVRKIMVSYFASVLRKRPWYPRLARAWSAYRTHPSWFGFAKTAFWLLSTPAKVAHDGKKWAATLTKRSSTRSPRQNGVVLTYHSIEDVEFDGLGTRISVGSFEGHLKYLKANFDVIPLSEVDAARSSPRTRWVALTFDDGYLSWRTHLLPLVTSYSCPIGLFVATSLVGPPGVTVEEELERSLITGGASRALAQPVSVPMFGPTVDLHSRKARHRMFFDLLGLYKGANPADRERLQNELRLAGLLSSSKVASVPRLSWSDLATMARNDGVTIGSHSHSHSNLATLTSNELDRDLVQSRELLQRQVGGPIDSLAIPYGQVGDFTPLVLDRARAAGYKMVYSNAGYPVPKGHLGGVIPRQAVGNVSAHGLASILGRLGLLQP